MVHLKSRFFHSNTFLQKLCSSLSPIMGEGKKNKQTSALIGCSVSGMTRSHGRDRGVFIKKPLVMQPKNSACPVISSLTKNHYIRCQNGSIFRQAEASHSPLTPPSLTAREPARWLQKLKATRWMSSKICSNQHLHPCSQDRRNHSPFVEAARTGEASLNSFSLLIVHNSYSAAEIWMPLCVAGSSARARHKARGAAAKSQVGLKGWRRGDRHGARIPSDHLQRKSILSVVQRRAARQTMAAIYWSLR